MEKLRPSAANRQKLHPAGSEPENFSTDLGDSSGNATATGLRLYRQIVPLALDYQTRLLAGLPRDDVERLEAMLKRLEEYAVRLQGVVAR